MKNYDLTTGNITKKLWAFALPLMLGNVLQQFYNLADTWIVGKYVGTQYLRIEGAFYIGIGILFMLYGYYRAVNKPAMSVVLTVISLGVRVFLAATLSKIASVGAVGIWVAVPIGWALADIVSVLYYLVNENKKKGEKLCLIVFLSDSAALSAQFSGIWSVLSQ